MSKKLKTTTSYIIIGIIFAVVIAGAAIYYAYQEGRKYVTASENGYNMAFFELVDYVQNVETYLAKALISTTPEHGAETLTNVWREASVAQSCLAQLPINSNELENTSKFLNQVSDYSYSLSRKAIGGENLSQEDFNNIKQLHTYSLDLENTLNQLSTDLNSGRIKWNELRDEGTKAFATQVSSITKDSFSNLEENFHEYAGLIYDGAFSEHISSAEKKGLTGEDIDEEKAKEIVNQFYGTDKIDNIESHGYSENAEIPSFDFNVKMKEGDIDATISISKKGGHVIFANYNRAVGAETLTQERADEIAKEFLNNHGYSNMKETYYLKQNGMSTDITKNMLKHCEGSIGKAIKINNLKDQYMQIEKIINTLEKQNITKIWREAEVIIDLLNYMEIVIYNLIKTENKINYINTIHIIEQTKQRILANANYDMSIDNLLLKLWEEVN